MNFFVLPSFTPGMALLSTILLTSCATYRTSDKDNTSPIVFNYSYQDPVRQQVASGLAQKLSKGKVGERVTTKLTGGQQSTIRLGENYFSANGYQCRRYTVNPSTLKTACKINNHWYQASPILIKE